MELIYLCSCVAILAVANAENDEKKTEQRDVNDAETMDYGSLPKIPVFVIPNTPPGTEGKIPFALIANAYAAQTYANAPVKNKPYKYGFYAPYKTPKVTPIHEPQNEAGYVTFAAEAPAIAYHQSADLFQRAEFEPASAYKAAGAIAAAPAPSPAPGFISYEPRQPKTLLSKQQSISNANYAPVYATYPAASVGENGVPAPQTKKYSTYDAENNLQIQYVIKYVPVPYTVQAGNTGKQQYAPQQVPESAYITPKPYLYKEYVKKPTLSVGQAVQPANAGSYASSTENYVELAKYAEAYASQAAEDSNSQYAPLPKSPYVQPQAIYNKYFDKNAYAKKYAPTSYVLASIGKSAATHYASSIRHDTVDHHHQNPLYATKIAPVPLTVDKYTSQDDGGKGYAESEYAPQPSSLYDVNSSELKYKSAFEAASPVPVHHLFNFEYSSPLHYQKKDVSASISNSSSNRKVSETSTMKSS